MKASMKAFRCLDCRKDTAKLDEYYMVRHDVWQAANPKIKGMLCIGCLEKRLKRKLDQPDFMWCDLNLMNLEIPQGSRRLRKRLLGL